MQTDGRTDRQTDRQTQFSYSTIVYQLLRPYSVSQALTIQPAHTTDRQTDTI